MVLKFAERGSRYSGGLLSAICVIVYLFKRRLFISIN